jgi:hypothetical protein
MSAQLSPDGLYYWDGTQWQSTLSHDGRTRWNGSEWVPVQGQGFGPSAHLYPPSGREPTSWTRPLQLAVAGWYALSAIYVLSLPFWMSGMMSQVVNQSIQRQQEQNPSASPLPADFASTMGSVMTGVLWVAAVLGVVICAVIIIGALRRWTWIYYVVLVFLGFSVISLPLDLVNAAGGSSISAASGFTVPSWYYLAGTLFAIPSIALFVWMVVALAKRGPWAMRRAQPVS